MRPGPINEMSSACGASVAATVIDRQLVLSCSKIIVTARVMDGMGCVLVLKFSHLSFLFLLFFLSFFDGMTASTVIQNDVLHQSLTDRSMRI